VKRKASRPFAYRAICNWTAREGTVQCGEMVGLLAPLVSTVVFGLWRKGNQLGCANGKVEFDGEDFFIASLSGVLEEDTNALVACFFRAVVVVLDWNCEIVMCHRINSLVVCFR